MLVLPLHIRPTFSKSSLAARSTCLWAIKDSPLNLRIMSVFSSFLLVPELSPTKSPRVNALDFFTWMVFTSRGLSMLKKQNKTKQNKTKQNNNLMKNTRNWNIIIKQYACSTSNLKVWLDFLNIKGALDKYYIIPQLFQKKLEIFIPLEVLAWVMTTCWVLGSRLIYLWRNMHISSIFYFSKSTSINTQHSSLWNTLKIMLFTKYLLKLKPIGRISWKFRCWFN